MDLNKLRPPREARIDVPQSEMSMVMFSSGLLEFIMMAGGTTDIKAGAFKGFHYVHVGQRRFEGATADEAYRKMLFWLLTAKLEMTAEEYAERAAAVLQMEDEDTESMLEILSEGGMTDFGKRVQQYRLERGGKLAEALQQLKTETGHLPKDVSVLQGELQRRTGYEDLDTQEILVAIGDLQRLEETLRT